MSKEQLDQARLKLYSVMLAHVGPNQKIGMGELFETVFEKPYHHRINDTKLLRKLITEMRRDGQPVLSDSSATHGGYWISASGSELNAYCEKGKRRALRILGRISRMKKVSLGDYLGQMRLELEE
jgi:hypothetical protein